MLLLLKRRPPREKLQICQRGVSVLQIIGGGDVEVMCQEKMKGAYGSNVKDAKESLVFDGEAMVGEIMLTVAKEEISSGEWLFDSAPTL